MEALVTVPGKLTIFTKKWGQFDQYDVLSAKAYLCGQSYGATVEVPMGEVKDEHWRQLLVSLADAMREPEPKPQKMSWLSRLFGRR